MTGGRHAYLIAAHGNLPQLIALLSLLDEPENDLVIHADAGWAGFSEQACRAAVTRAGISFVPRLRCPWGSPHFVDALVSLLAEAVKTEHQYYHMISGQDLPLRTQAEIRAFFDAHDGEEFVEFDDPADMDRLLCERLRYYFLFPPDAGRLFFGASKLDRLTLSIQRALKIDRISGCAESFGKGAVWFSITHALACYAVSRAAAIRRRYRFSRCADELWLQTLVQNSPFAQKLHSAAPGDTLANMVCVDWTRGSGNSPYTFTLDDYDMLIKRPELFARKFDAARDPELYEKMAARVRPAQ